MLIKIVDDRIHFLETELDDLRTQSDKLREAGDDQEARIIFNNIKKTFKDCFGELRKK